MAELPQPTASPPERLGPYRVEGRLGRGGMGEVFSAWDGRLQRRVAIKRLHPEKGTRRRLLREARAAAAIDHPAVVQIFDVLEEGDELWVVMAYLDGRSLAEQIQQSGRLSIADARRIARLVAEGLGAAHGRGLVHRDLKSENIMMLRDGGLKIVDFGIAKSFETPSAVSPSPDRTTPDPSTPDPSAPDPSTLETVIGTTRSMSPEQALGRRVDPRSDLFSLGVLLYEALTGRSPFWAESPNETLVRVCSHTPTPVEEIRPEIPPELAKLVRRLLEKDPNGRPADARAVIEALDASAFADGGADSSRPGAAEDTLQHPAPPGAPGPTEAASTGPAIEKESAPRQKGPDQVFRRRVLTRLILATLAFSGLAALILILGTDMLRSRIADLPAGDLATSSPTLRVAVEPPSASGEDVPLLRSLMEISLQRALLGRRGLVVVAAEEDEPTPADPQSATRQLGAEQLLRSSLVCQEEACRASLSRWRSDGTLAGSVEIPLATWEPALTQESLSLAIDELFPDHPGRSIKAAAGQSTLENLFRLRRDYEGGLWAGRESELLTEVTTLRQDSPRLIEAYIFEADLLRRPPLSDAQALERAAAVLDAALALAPEDPRPALAAVRVALAASDFDAAKRLLDELDRSQPGHPSLLRYRANLAAGQGDLATATEWQEKAAARQPSLKNLYQLATFQHQVGRIEAARETLDRLLGTDPDHLAGLWMQAQLELLHGQPDRAAELYTALSEQRSHVVVSANLGVSLLLAGRPREALEHLEAALAERPQSASIQLNKADALQRLGRPDEAAEAYRKVLLLVDDFTAEPWQRLSISAQAHAHLGAKVAAAEAIGRALALAPDSPQVAYEAALVYALIGEESSAQAHRRRALDSGIAPAWFEASFFSPDPPRH